VRGEAVTRKENKAKLFFFFHQRKEEEKVREMFGRNL